MQLQDIFILLLRIQAIHASATSVHEWRRQQESESSSNDRTFGHSGGAAKGVSSIDSGTARTIQGDKGLALKRAKGVHKGMMFRGEHQLESNSRASPNLDLNRLLRGYESEEELAIGVEKRKSASKIGMSVTEETSRASRPFFASFERPPPTRPPVSAPTRTPVVRPPSSAPETATFSPRQDENSSPLATETIGTSGGCLADENGLYGSSEGDSVSIYFFYQVEVVPGTSESDMNSEILDDIEQTLVDFMIPRIFQDECGPSTASRRLQNNGKYLGIDSRPADFVLRGFECGQNAVEPCYAVSGSMTIFAEGKDREQVRLEMRSEIFQIMNNGGVAQLVPRVEGMALLNDSLDVETLPPGEPTTPQFTNAPTFAQLTSAPSAAPSIGPTTDAPSSPPTLPPSTLEPATAMLTDISPTLAPETPIPTADYTTAQPTATTTTTTTAAPVTEKPNTEPPVTSPEIIETTTEPTQSKSSETPEIQSSDPPFNFLNQTLDPATFEATPNPNPKYYTMRNSDNALKKVPIWGWVIIGLGIFVICAYTDPDDDDQKNDRAQRDAMNTHSPDDQHANNLDDHENDNEAAHARQGRDGNVEQEYARKLYRQ